MIYGGKTGFDDLNEVVMKAHSKLSTHLDKFDSLAATGVSGITVAAPLAVLLNKPLVVVRKKDDGSHNVNQLVEGHLSMGKRVLFVDDFIAGGDTKARVVKAIHGIDKRADLIGQYLYLRDGLEWFNQR